jgi:serine/threonine protein kinase
MCHVQCALDLPWTRCRPSQDGHHFRIGIRFLSASIAAMSRFADKFEIGEKLGAGHYAEVFLCRNKATGAKSAVKVIDKSRTTTKQQGEFLGEVAILKEVNHAHCLRLEGYFDEGQHVFVVLELITGGELFAKICEERNFSEQKAASMMKDILSGLAYLHSKGIIHRDLKPENLLLTSKDENASIKLVDFGFAEQCGKENRLTKCCGTPLYIAPEVLNAGLFKTGPPYGLAADMWSIGVILYVLLCGYPPFRAKTQADQFKKVVQGKFDFPEHKVWGSISAEAKDLVSRLITLDPTQRLTAEQALKHPWMKNHLDEHLASTVEALKHFSAEKTWKRGIYGVEALNRILYLRKCTAMGVKPNSGIERLLTEATESVTVIDLSKNYVGARGLMALLDVVENNHTVEALVLGNNGANNQVVERLCTMLRTHPSITSVNLNHNPISHLAGRMILYAIQVNPRIITLSLEGTVLQPVMLSRIALQLHRNQTKTAAIKAAEASKAAA